MEQNTLVLDILKQADTLEMSIFEEKELASTVRHYSRCPFSFTEINKLCREVTVILNTANKKGLLASEPSGNLKKIGQLLWDHLLSRPVKERLKTTIIRNLVLSLDETLIEVPWELLYDGSIFLSLKFNLGRVIRTKEDKAPPQYRSLAGKPKMLILANPTNDLKSAYVEGTFIKNHFDKKRNQISINFKSTQIDKIYVKKNLRDYDIVHFAGHCEFDAENAKNSGWVLSDGNFSGHDIMAMSETLPLPTLIFSNACQSAHVTKGLIDPDYQKNIYNLASAFIFSGVRHYIGTVRKIEDPVSLLFSKEFYIHLFKGKSVGESLCLARMKLIHEYGIDSIFWTSYLLYGDPNFTLFRAKSKAEIIRFKRDFSWYKKRIIVSAIALSITFAATYLYMWLPTVNPNTYFMFAKSRGAYIRGRNQEAISLCSSLIQKEPLFLAAYPLLADTYQRIGRRDLALKYYFEYALYSEKKRAPAQLICAYIGIGWIYQAQGDYRRAFDFYNKSIALARDNKDKLNEAGALRRLAVWHIDKQEFDKALELLIKSSEINRGKEHIREHRYNLACDYFDIGLVFINKDDFAAAREFYSKSLRLFEKMKLKGELSDYYFNVGEIYLFEKQYDRAQEYYMKGMAIDRAQGNLPGLASGYDMLGELYVEMGNLEKAAEFFNRGLSVCKEINALPELASIYHNLGLLYEQKRQKNKAREYLCLAQELYYSIDTNTYQEIKQELLGLAD